MATISCTLGARMGILCPASSLLALLLLALLAPRTANASPQDLFSYGPRSVAMGGLGATFVDDFGAVHANPAGLSRARERAVSLGLVGVSYDLWVERGETPAARYPVERARAVLLGITVPLPLAGALRERVALGIGLHLPLDVISRNRIARPETPQFPVLEHRAQSIALQFGLGALLPGGFRIGGGAAVLAALSGRLTVMQDTSGTAVYRVDDRLVASYAGVGGLSWDRGIFRAGAVVRSPLVGQLEVQIETRDLGLALPIFDVSGIAQYDPWQVALEVALAPGRWTLALGTTLKFWTGYPSPVRRTTRASPAPPPPNFANTAVLRIGAEHRWNFRTSHLALRGGYFFEPTPAPEATGISNYLDNDRHAFTVGVGLGGRALGTALTLDLFTQVHALAPRRALKAMDVRTDNPGYPSVASGGAIFYFGLSATVTL